MHNDRAILVTVAIGLAVWVYLFLTWNPWSDAPPAPAPHADRAAPNSSRVPPAVDPAEIWVEVESMEEVSADLRPAPSTRSDATGSPPPAREAPARPAEPADEGDRLSLRVGGDRPPATGTSPVPMVDGHPVVIVAGPDGAGHPTVPAPPGPASATRFHVVQKGDTLSQLAQKYLGSSRHWRRLFEANRALLKSPHALPVGAKLALPGADPAAAAPQPLQGQTTRAAPAPDPNSPAAADAARTYVIARGDTLTRVSARLYGQPGRWRRLYEANRQVVRDPDRLKPGTVLVVP